MVNWANMTSSRTTRYLMVFLSLSLLAACANAQEQPAIVSQFAPLGQNEKLIVDGFPTTSVYRNKKTEENLLFRSERAGPIFKDVSGNVVFFASPDKNPEIDTYKFYEIDGSRGRIVDVANVSGILTVTQDAKFTIFADWDYTMRNKKNSGKYLTRIVVVSNVDLVMHSEYLVGGLFRQDGNIPRFIYNPTEQTFTFRIQREDDHVETFEGNLRTKTVKSIGVSKEVDGGM